MKILLATDGSNHSMAAAEEIASRPFPTSSELRIISVFENPALYLFAPAPMGGMDRYYQEAEFTAKKMAEETIEKVAELIGKNNTSLSISAAVIEGSPKQEILTDAEEFGADLIVVGSHGRGGFEKFLLGSVSQSVALHAQCSVEIVRKRNFAKEEQ
ncbi:nucleotide-binding universal stress UspA family protein [Pedobacter sp. UYEF25]